MAQPSVYDRQNSFTALAAADPSEPYTGAQLDTEFNAVKITLDEILANLALIQADDGDLANGVVSLDSMGFSIVTGMDAPVAWATGMAFTTRSSVFYEQVLYHCNTAHTSGATFAADAAKWDELDDFSSIVVGTASIEDLAVTAAKLAANSVTTAKILNSNVTYAKIQNVSATDKLLGRVSSGAGVVEEITFTDFAQSLLDDADAATARTTLGAQTLDTSLTQISALSIVAGDLLYGSATDVISRLAKHASNYTALTLVSGLPAWAGLPLVLPQGRLTLATATPVMTSDLTAQTTIYYTPYVGNYCPIWDGTVWAPRTFSELSLALDSDSGHTGYHQIDKNFDLFVVDDSSTIRLVSGPAWSSNTARGTGAGTTELAYTNGLPVNANSMTARFGSGALNTITVAAGKGTYVGSVRTTANGQTQWVASPAAAAGGGACTLYLWNMYNRRSVAAYSRDSTDSWVYTTATIRAANAAGTGSGLNNRVSILRGLDEGAVQARYSISSTNSTVATLRRVFVGLDSVTAFAAGSSPGDAMADNMTASAFFSSSGVGLGLHYVQALEWSAATGACTWYGDNGTTTLVQMVLSLQTEM